MTPASSPTTWLVLGSVLLVLFGVLGLLARAGPLAVDQTLIGLLPRGVPPLPVRLANRLASAPVWIIVALLVAAVTWRRASLPAAALVLLAEATAEVASLVSRLIVARQVPDHELADAAGSWWDTLNSSYLFPSGHVVRVTVLLGLITALLWQRAPAARLPLLVACTTLLLLLGYARVDVRAHLPTDVLGGYLLGGACLALALTARESWRRC
jgi:undecaprenyl-diphosphatase